MHQRAKNNNSYDEIIYLTPDGQKLNQSICNNLSLKQNIILLCGHYKGIDHRIREHLITKEISIGDYVITGGELAASILTDAIVRLIPGAISDETSALNDSFQDNLLPLLFTLDHLTSMDGKYLKFYFLEIKKKLKDGEKKNQLKELIILDQIY